jgi:hypothetical protein
MVYFEVIKVYQAEVAKLEQAVLIVFNEPWMRKVPAC